MFEGVPDKSETRRIWPVHLATGPENRSWFTVKGPDGKVIKAVLDDEGDHYELMKVK